MQSNLYKKSLITKAVACICLQQGWYGVTNIALDTLSDLLETYITYLAESTKEYAELSQRTNPILGDVEIAFKHAGVDDSDLIEYLLSLDSSQMHLNAPYFPAQRSLLSENTNNSLNVVNVEDRITEDTHLKLDDANLNNEKKQVETNSRRQANLRALPEEIHQSTYEMKCFTSNDCEDNFPLCPGRLPITSYQPSSSENEMSDVDDVGITPIEFPQYEPIVKHTDEDILPKIDQSLLKQKSALPSVKKKPKSEYDPPFNVHQQRSKLKVGTRGFGRSRGRRGRRPSVQRGGSSVRKREDEITKVDNGESNNVDLKLTSGEIKQTIIHKWASIRSGRGKRIVSQKFIEEETKSSLVKTEDIKDSLDEILHQEDTSERIFEINDEVIAAAADEIESPQLIFDKMPCDFASDTDKMDKEVEEFDQLKYDSMKIESRDPEEAKLASEINDLNNTKDDEIIDEKNLLINPAEEGLTWTDDDDEEKSPIKFSPSYLNISPHKEKSHSSVEESKESFDENDNYDEADPNDDVNEVNADNVSNDADVNDDNHLSESLWPKVIVRPLSPSLVENIDSSPHQDWQPPLKKIKIGFSAGSECSIKNSEEYPVASTSKIQEKKKRKKNLKEMTHDKKAHKTDSKETAECSQVKVNICEDQINSKSSKPSNNIYDESDNSEKMYDESEASEEEFDNSVQWEVVREDVAEVEKKDSKKEKKKKDKRRKTLKEKHDGSKKIRSERNDANNIIPVESLDLKKDHKPDKVQYGEGVHKSEKHLNKKHEDRKKEELQMDIQPEVKEEISKNKKTKKVKDEESKSAVKYEIMDPMRVELDSQPVLHRSRDKRLHKKSKADISKKNSHEIAKASIPKLTLKFGGTTLCGLSTSFQLKPNASTDDKDDSTDDKNKELSSSDEEVDVGLEDNDEGGPSISSAPIKLIIKPFGNKNNSKKSIEPSNRTTHQVDSPLSFSPSPERFHIPSPVLSPSLSPSHPATPSPPSLHPPIKLHSSRVQHLKHIATSSSSSWSSSQSHSPSPPILSEPIFNYEVKDTQPATSLPLIISAGKTKQPLESRPSLSITIKPSKNQRSPPTIKSSKIKTTPQTLKLDKNQETLLTNKPSRSKERSSTSKPEKNPGASPNNLTNNKIITPPSIRPNKNINLPSTSRHSKHKESPLLAKPSKNQELSAIRPGRGIDIPVATKSIKIHDIPVTSKSSKDQETSLINNLKLVVPKKTVGKIQKANGEVVWICPTCNKPDDGSPMIGCDTCDDWYHWPCVGITKEPPKNTNWFCVRCLNKNKHSSDSKNKSKRTKK